MRSFPLLTIGLTGMAVAMTATGAGAQNGAEPAAIRSIEQGLRPAVVVRGEPERKMALEERMRHYHVTGVSVAVIDKGRVVWARGFGKRAEGDAPVTADTLFQAASMSKPVAAAVSLTLASQGKIGLDAPVNDVLKQWKLPSSEVAPASEVTLRRLLSHSAGLTVHGFGGYAAGAPVPTVPQLLDGVKPANSAAVRIDLKPGSKWRYSGGGTTIAQAMVEDVTGRRFADAAQAIVLGPVGMAASGYLQPLPAARESQAAIGHDSAGKPIAGRWHTYPELAAAGLWTTPSDLARFLIAVDRASKGATDAGLAPQAAQWLIEPQKGIAIGTDAMGLGLFLEGEGRARRFGHGGANEGYRSVMTLFPETGQGAVIMTNGDDGGDLASEIMRGIAATYHWPDLMQRTTTAVRTSEAALIGFVGRYTISQFGNMAVDVVREGDHLVLKIEGEPPTPLRAEAGDRFFNEDAKTVFGFVRGQDGKATTLTISSGTGDPIVATRAADAATKP